MLMSWLKMYILKDKRSSILNTVLKDKVSLDFKTSLLQQSFSNLDSVILVEKNKRQIDQGNRVENPSGGQVVFDKRPKTIECRKDSCCCCCCRFSQLMMLEQLRKLCEKKSHIDVRTFTKVSQHKATCKIQNYKIPR